ncbi:hypothetical protein UFOVP229_38 [uncultured Caudovirales phage]|uniref:Uncharacterized protein n=1 Tax=uncultured Caudovirales phage TaxID=2100421 RepID=A0A6J7WM63_9CAUD|nr:hypothetical protein UFOVP229_38 [uncultured Caudovirales phage]
MIRLAVFDADQHRERFSVEIPSNSTAAYVMQTIDRLRCDVHNRVYDGWINEYDTDWSTTDTVNHHDL